MKPIYSATSTMAIALVLSSAAQGQESPVGPESSEDDIVVVAERILGQVDTDLPPVLELDEADIKAFGSDSIADLVAQLTPQVSSGSGRGSGRPVFLVNGQRVSGFREFSRYPPEAIRKVEVLPEEVALQFGFPATQRVINFILKDDFASREVEFEYGGPTAGGRDNGEVEASLLTINGSRRFQIGAEYNAASLLTEDERNIVQTPGSVPTLATDPDPAQFRSLASDSESLQIETTYNAVLGSQPGAGTVSLNGNFERQFSRSLSGLDTVQLTSPGGTSALRALDSDPLERLNRTTTASFGSSVNKPLGEWEFALTLDASHVWTDTDIDRRRDTQALRDAALAGVLAIDGALPAVADAGQDRASSRLASATSLATLRGTPILLPAGEVNVTFDAGYAWNRIASEDTRSGVGETVLKRGDLTSGINVGLPIASEREGFLGALGEVSVNLGAGVNELSDFGTLTDWTTGLTWRPIESLSLQASYAEREQAPGLGRLGDPAITTFNVPVFDLANSETVLATVTSGGNPLLSAEKQRDVKVGADYDFELFDRANLLVEYFRNRSEDVTEGFPVLTPAVEAAFAGRVSRDSSGRLTAIDRRPITFAERNSSRVRYGFNISGRVGKPRPAAVEGGGRSTSGGAPPTDTPSQRGQATGGPASGEGRAGASFDPAQFAQLREQFCGLADPMTFDFSVLPEQMRARLLDVNGQIDPERVRQLQQRFCSSAGVPGDGPDPQQMAAIREMICTIPADGSLPDLSGLPERMLERLRGPDGAIDPTRLANLRQRMCSTDGQSSDTVPAPTAQGGGRGRGAGGGGLGRFGPGGGDGQGRWFLSLYHSIELESEALVAPGVPLFDLLDGDALGSGGVPRHRVQLEGGLFHRGFGLRMSGNYIGTSRISGSGLPGSSDLAFNDIATFNLRIFVDLEQQKWLTGSEPGFLKGARISFRADNILDAQQRVTDETGAVPISYQPDLIDPLGRQLEVEFRKVF